MKPSKMMLWGGSLLMVMLLQSCLADMRTSLIKKEGITTENVSKGKAILEASWQKHGFDKLSTHQSYSFQGSDVWKGMLGKMGKPWPEAESDIAFKYVVGTFDSQVRFNNGKREGSKAGLQSWKYYEQEPNGELEFMKYNPRIGFGLAAYQYFFEMLDRLKKVPIISYAGEKTFNGNEYELVFATWDKAEPSMDHDQYLLWINKQTGLLDYAVYSLRESYLKMPGYKAFYGSIKFDDYRRIEGVLVPHKQTVFFNEPAKKEKKHLHQLLVKNFQFDSFDIKELYPNPEIPVIGDSKKEVSHMDSTAKTPNLSRN